jgi:FMN phosphatase YigB (HAD superfamily)
MNRNFRAVICDVYRTILDVGPGPMDAERRWAELHSAAFGEAPLLSLAGLNAGCRAMVERDHAVARRLGVEFPEVVWRDVMRRVLPELGTLSPPGEAEFLDQHMRLERSVSVMNGAVEFLAACRERGILLGIASNAQPYTLRELAECGVEIGWFEPDLCVWSFENGFSKPNPHVFRMLSARLAHRSIGASEVLMVGDREDNDVVPARAAGWGTFWFGEEGGWPEVRERASLGE